MGVRGKQPSNGDGAPQFAAGAPPKPSGMGVVQSKHWDYLVAILEPANVLNVAHGVMLEMMCEDYADIVRYREQMKEWEFNGKLPVTKGAKGNSVIHPVVRLLDKAKASYDKYAAMFGMTPLSIGRVKVSKRKKVDAVGVPASKSGVEGYEPDEFEASLNAEVDKQMAAEEKAKQQLENDNKEK